MITLVRHLPLLGQLLLTLAKLVCHSLSVHFAARLLLELRWQLEHFHDDGTEVGCLIVVVAARLSLVLSVS